MESGINKVFIYGYRDCGLWKRRDNICKRDRFTLLSREDIRIAAIRGYRKKSQEREH